MSRARMAALPHGIRRAFRLALRRPRIEEEVDAEIAFHLEMRAAELVARGLTPDAARAEAVRRFGDTHQWGMAMSAVDRERAARQRRAEWLDDLRQDLRFAARSALRAPLFSLLAVLTLALGIGANAAVFGVVKSVLLDALPYAGASRLVRAYGSFRGGDQRGPLSAGTVTDIAARQRSFERVAMFMTGMLDAVYEGDGGPRVAKATGVEPALFPTLGVRAALGRTFRDDDDASDTAAAVLLTHAAWQRLLGGDPGVLGHDLRIDGTPHPVVGVLPRDFVGPSGDVDFYFPLDLRPSLRDPLGARRSHWLGLIGRLKPGVTYDAARRELVAIAADLEREHPKDNAGITVNALPLRDALVGDTRTPLLVLMASAGLVLLITCANLAGALLSRTLTRRKEFAVRVALGAGRGRLVRQLLTESTLLALAGGAAGVLLATLGLGVLRGLAATSLPTYADLSLDPGAVLVTAALTLVTGLAFGAAPALSAGRSDPQGTLRDAGAHAGALWAGGGRGASEGRRARRLRGVLVAGQIALCLSLLAGAGLLARSLWTLTSTPLGFDPDGVLAATVQLPYRDYSTPDAILRFHQRFEERLRALPGVLAVANVGQLPAAVGERMGFTIEGAPPPPSDAQPFVLFTSASDGYFRTLRIPVRRGRTFDARDRAGAPPVVVISQSMARRYWPGGDAVGARIRLGPDPNGPWIEVIGVVGDVRNDPARRDAEPMAYVSNRQSPWGNVSFLLRTRSDPLALAKPVQRELAALDRGLPIQKAVPLRALVAEGLAGRRLPVVLLAAFGALALALASVGVYAMFAGMAAAREREFGVRVALGSSRRAIAALVLRQGAAWMALGLAGGALGVLVVARLLRGLLVGVAPLDPLALGAAAVVLIACATAALLVPIRRATRADPVAVLR